MGRSRIKHNIKAKIKKKNMKRFFSVLSAMCVYTSLSAQTNDSIEKEFGSLIDNLAKDFSQHDYILSDANLIYELAIGIRY